MPHGTTLKSTKYKTHMKKQCVLIHLMLLVSFFTPWKHQKTIAPISRGIKRDQGHEMDLKRSDTTKSIKPTAYHVMFLVIKKFHM